MRPRAASMAVVDPDRRPTNAVSARVLAELVREVDSRSEREGEDVLETLLWMAWPSLRSQDQ